MRAISLPPALALVAGILAISTGAIFLRLSEAPSSAEAFWRCALAALLLAPLAGRRLPREWLALSGRERRGVLLAGLFLAAHFAAWIESLAWTSVAQSVLLVTTTPLWVALLAPAVTGDRLGPRARLGIGLALLGAVVMHLERPVDAVDPWRGAALALIGAWCAAGYLLLGRRLHPRMGLFPYSVACYGTAAIALLLLCLTAEIPLLGYTPATWGWLALAAAVPQGIGHTALNAALRRASAPLVATSLLGEPIGATLLAWAVLAEPPTAALVLGAPLVLWGIVLTARGEPAPRPPRPVP